MSTPIQISKDFSQYVQQRLNANPAWELWLQEKIQQPLSISEIALIFEKELPTDQWLHFDEVSFL
ncbi:MAG: hypothetical protein RL528_681, partial [Bacteroidota bacterium]